MYAEKLYLQWKEKVKEQEELRRELEEMDGHEEEIEECFGKRCV